jgi:type II secretory pathway pseudopilin PulG
MPARAAPAAAPARRGQSGQAFIVAVLIAGVLGSMLVFNLAASSRDALESERKTAAALAQAKEGLIAYASGQDLGASWRPGELPCPDTDNDGQANTPCNTAASRIGRLPWKTLRLPDLRDGAGERLWYAVSSTFKNSTQTGILNSDTAGDYTVTGAAPASQVIALVIAPGASVGAQLRDAANQNIVSHYLEGGNENAAATLTFVSAQPGTAFNDRLLALTRDTFFPAVENRVAMEMRRNLGDYYTVNRYYPPAASFTGTTCAAGNYRGRLPISGCTLSGVTLPGLPLPAWFTPNNWHEVMVYGVAPRCTPEIITTTTTNWIIQSTDIGGCVFFFFFWLCPITTTTTSVNPATLNCGHTAAGPFLTVSGVGSMVESLLFTGGYGLAGQPRPCAQAAHCLEDAQNTDGAGYPGITDGADNYVYVRPQKSATNNDRLTVVRP